MKIRILGLMAGVFALMPALAARAPSTLEQANAYTDSKVAAEATARQSADSNEATARGNADTQEASIRGQSDSALQSQIDALAAASSTGGLGAYEGVERIGSVMYANGQLFGNSDSGTDAAVVGIITSNGYLVELAMEPYPARVNKAPGTLYFQGENCTGQAFLGLPTRSTWKEFQGYVFSVAEVLSLYYIPRGTTSGAGLRTLRSAVTPLGTCNTPLGGISNTGYTRPAFPNDPAITGVSDEVVRYGIVFGVPL